MVFPSTSITTFNKYNDSSQEKERRILVVDDDKNQRFLSAMQLVGINKLPCIFVGNGSEAVKALSGERFTQLTVPFFVTNIIFPKFLSDISYPLSSPPSQPIDIHPSINVLPKDLSQAFNLDANFFPSSPPSSPPFLPSYMTTPSTSSLTTTAPASALASPAETILEPNFTLEEIGVEIAAVLMDYNMPPGIDGLEATKQIRANEASHPDHIRVPIYLYSASDVIEGVNTKSTDFLDSLKKRNWDLDDIIPTKSKPNSLMEYIPMFEESLGFVSEEQSSDDEWQRHHIS